MTRRVRPPAAAQVTRIRSARGTSFLAFLVALLAVAFFTQEDLLLYLLYAVIGLHLLGRWWARRSLAAVTAGRSHDNRAFLGQQVPVEVQVHNRGWLPVLWLRLADAVPAELSPGVGFQHVVSLLPRERQTLRYGVRGLRRGYYPFGALTLQGGDLLGTAAYESRHAEGDFLVVYPRIVALPGLELPSQSPLGTLPGRERLFDDPSRVRGVRDYQPGDSLRRMDWKASARLGALQVRRLEPAIALATAIALNLDGDDHPGAARYDAAELAITIAASLAVHVVEKRQAVGLATNGRDPFRAAEAGPCPAFPLHQGREHLMHLLDLLARVEVASEATPFVELLSRASLGLPWGSTVAAITSFEVDGLLEALLTLRRRGLALLLVLTRPDLASGGWARTARRAAQIGVRAVRIDSERDLGAWR